MTNQDFKKILLELDMDQKELASIMKVDIRTVNRWGNPKIKIPGPVKAALNAWLKLHRLTLPFRPNEIELVAGVDAFVKKYVWEKSMIAEAAKFAFEAHHSINQRRKYTGEPYFEHCKNVAYLVSLVTDDEEMIAAAYLHDVLEDVKPTNPKYDENLIRDKFGENVLKYVIELTEVKTEGNRDVRKKVEADRLSTISDQSVTIKYADLIDNSKSIIACDKGFARIYMQEKEYLLDKLKGKGDIFLLFIVDNILNRWKDRAGEILSPVESRDVE